MPQQFAAPLAPTLKIGSVLRDNKTGREGVVVGFDPRNPKAPIVRDTSSAHLQATPTTTEPAASGSSPLEQWSNMLRREMNAPAPQFTPPSSNMSPYGRAIEESAELGGQAQATALREKEIEAATKNLGDIAKASLEAQQAEGAEWKKKLEEFQGKILDRMLNAKPGELSQAQQDYMFRLLVASEGKLPSGTAGWTVEAHPGMPILRINRETGQVIPVAGAGGKEIVVPRAPRLSTSSSKFHPHLVANAALGNIMRGASSIASSLLAKGQSVNADYVLAHPEIWDDSLKASIGNEYEQVVDDLEEHGFQADDSLTDPTAQLTYLMRLRLPGMSSVRDKHKGKKADSSTAPTPPVAARKPQEGTNPVVYKQLMQEFASPGIPSAPTTKGRLY